VIRFRLSAVALAYVSFAASPALAQSDQSDAAEEEIVVTGQRPRGSVVGDIQPELQLNAGDVRALGASNISDLLAELAPQTQSGRGGAPLVLLEGHRVSSFREIATIPTEAIVRVDILPEEVALKYGYPANQKVLNIVLRRRFRAATVEAKDRVATEGGGNKATGSANFLAIRRSSRLNLNMDYERTGRLLQSQRGITTATGGDTMRTLVPSERQLTIDGTYYRPVSDRVGVTLNGELTTDQTRGLLGSSVPSAVIPGGSPFSSSASDTRFTPIVVGSSPLDRSVSTQTAHLGTTVNADGRFWRGTLTATFDHDEGRTLSDQRYDLSRYQAALAAGDPAANPALPVAPAFVISRPADIARSRSDIAATDLTLNGSLYKLPAGDISLTARAGASVSRFASDSVRTLLPQSTRLDRTVGLGALSLDLPLVNSPSPFLGRLWANGNVELQSLSDFGTVRTIGYGLNWTPHKGVGLIASFKDEQSAPTAQQLGNGVTVTPDVPVFDFATGQTALVQQVAGGNPNLFKADQRDWRLGLTLKPFAKPDITITVDYNRTRTDNGIVALPGISAASALAFPGRFLRDASGALIEIDTRPVNIAHQDSSQLRWGINFTKALKTPQSQIDAMRAAFQQRNANGAPDRPRGDGTRAGRQGGGGFGGRGGGGRGGRLNFAVYHTWHLTETATLRDGLPAIDLLNGGTIGSQAGQPRHEVEVQAGYSQSGIGVRLTGNWQSATRVVDPVDPPAANLRFSDLATANLRVFANVGQLPGLVGKSAWLRGLRVSLSVDNIFSERQRVTDANGITPLAYRPGLIDPLGRTVTFSIRRQFF